MENVNYEKLAQALASAFPASPEKGKLSTQEQIELLKAVASDPVARAEYAKSRAEVLLPLIPVQSTARQIFRTEKLAPGAQAYYPINFDYTEVASFLPKMGGVVTKVVEGDEIYIPTFGIEAAVRWSMDIAEQGRIGIAGQMNDLLKNRIIAKEEYAAWRTIKGTLSGLNTNQTIYCSGNATSGENFHSFSKKALNALTVQMDIQRRALTHVFASPASLGDVRMWSNNQIDFTTQREIFVNGGLPGNEIWNTQLVKVYDSSLVDNTEAWGFDVRSLGVMPIQKELETYEDPVAILQWQVGIMARERVGFGITDSWAMVKAVMDSSHLSASCTTV